MYSSTKQAVWTPTHLQSSSDLISTRHPLFEHFFVVLRPLSYGKFRYLDGGRIDLVDDSRALEFVLCCSFNSTLNQATNQRLNR
jgi:hypothetical protein